jgi:hypothetical protein
VLDAVAVAPYAVYYADHWAASEINSVTCDLGVHGVGQILALPLVPGQIAGLAGDAALDWIKGHTVHPESMDDEGQGSTVLVNPCHVWLPGGPRINDAPGIEANGHWDISW